MRVLRGQFRLRSGFYFTPANARVLLGGAGSVGGRAISLRELWLQLLDDAGIARAPKGPTRGLLHVRRLRLRDIGQGMPDRASEMSHVRRVQISVRGVRRALPKQEQLSSTPVVARARQAVSMRRMQRHFSLPSGSTTARETASTGLRAAAKEAPLRAVQQAFLPEASATGAHEDARQRRPAERIHMPDMRQVRVQQDLPGGASAQAHWREAAHLRCLRQGLHLAKLPERASSHAHWREAASLPALQQEIHATDDVGGTLAGSYGRSTLSLHVLSQIVRFENDAELASKDACEAKRAATTRAGATAAEFAAAARAAISRRSFVS